MNGGGTKRANDEGKSASKVATTNRLMVVVDNAESLLRK